MLKNRYLTKYILEDLLDKMVFVGGARQVGKTTLAKKMLPQTFLRLAIITGIAKKIAE